MKPPLGLDFPSKPRGIIFDMDGVLMHSGAIHAEAFRSVLSELPVKAFSYARIAGMRTDEALRLVLGENGISFSGQQIEQWAARKSSLARERIARANPIEPSCPQVIRELAGKFRLALASSASKATVALFLDSNRLREYFHCVLDGSMVEKAKPEPEIYLLSSERMEVPVGDCLVIEDAVSGIRAAKSAGMMAWGLPTTCAAEELYRAGADRVLDQFEDLSILMECS